MRWTHARAVWTMVGVTALWSIAGIVTRQLESAQSFEVTFWRSLFTVVSLLVILPLYQGREFFSRLFYAPRVLWLSGVCWAVMFTAFMVALTLAPVAEVLITMAVGPLLSALIARIFFGQRIALHTWCAIALAGVGMVWMFARPSTNTQAAGAALGTWVALLVPTSAAVNWSVVQHAQTRGESIDMVPAVLVGAVLSALCTLPLAWPLQASGVDVAWLALLGLVQLAVPCVLVVVCARVLPAPEISLLALLEVLFGIALAWLGANEVPSSQVLSGGTLVVLALLLNAWWTQRLTTGDKKT
jgi:drug/metabolite transporter (DMT)-like permease